MITPLADPHRPELAALLEECLGADTQLLDEAMWRWTYRANPCGDGTESVLVFADEDEVFGVLGMLPVRLSGPGGELDASWGIDIFVLPEFQNAGIGGLLIEGWDERTPVSLSLGVTDMAFEVFLSSGRVHVGDVPVYKRLLAPARALEQKLGSRWKAAAAGTLLDLKRRMTTRAAPAATERGALTWEPLERFDAAFDALWVEASAGLGLAVKRSPAWLEWRFGQYPRGGFRPWKVLEGGKLAGYVVTTTIQRDGLRVGFVADVLCAERDVVLRFALERAVAELQAAGADVVECLASQPEYQAALLATGFLERPTNTRLLYKLNDPALAAHLAGAERLASWHVTFADSDDLTVQLCDGDAP